MRMVLFVANKKNVYRQAVKNFINVRKLNVNEIENFSEYC